MAWLEAIMAAAGGSNVSFQQLEYIEATGSQYINLNDTLNNTDKLEIRIALTGSESVKEIAYRDENNQRCGMFVTSNVGVAWGNNYKTFGTVDSNPHTHILDAKNSKYIRDSQEWAFSTSAQLTSTTPLYVLASSPTSNYRTQGRLYSLKIYKNDILAMDLIPVRLSITSSEYSIDIVQIGMFDNVSKKMFLSATTDAFIAGPDV